VRAPEESDTVVTREDEDDYDLLTFGEAGARLDHEIRSARARVGQLEESGTASAGDVDGARARLDALVDAARRNARQPINDENFQRFFGYEGKARRNTT
jgi:hypothetical protein